MKKKQHERTPELRREQIERRAYELYQARGGTGSRELEDWLQAEREIDAAPRGVPRDSDVIRGM